MQASGGDWITWKRNPPYASHMSGVWERQIHSARSILSSLMQTHGRSLDEESLATLMAETEGILNSRPLKALVIRPVVCPSLHQKFFNHEIKDNLATSRRFFET